MKSKKVISNHVIIDGDDRDRLKISFDKILNSSIPLNELKMVVAYLGAITKTANFQIEKG